MLKIFGTKLLVKKTTLKSEQKPDVPPKPPEPTPKTEVKTEPESIEMNDIAREEYEKIRSRCNGRITASVRDASHR